ncbi:MAG: TetR/AcrR family transcriptional regulator [Reyranella sp.]|uniref:TetR/AcrR family transcriptional regulator n=1 Tax=Reyranella sp. TaxID=1929291 RepID=UPI003D0FEEF5
MTKGTMTERRKQAGRRAVGGKAAAAGRQPRRRGAESRLRILEATFALAHELGYQGTSISKVVERSGLPASSVYWHFADKDALFAAMIHHSFEQWAASLPRWSATAGTVSRRDELARRIRSAIASIASSPEFWRLGLVLSLQRQPGELQARRLFKQIRRRVIASMAEFWRQALLRRPGRRSGDLPEMLARITMATADGLFVSAQIDSERDHERLADLLADMLESAAVRLS